LIPGMFGTAIVKTAEPKRYLTLPQTAISYNPYGNVVYIIAADPKNPKQLIANQSFVNTGEVRGEQVVVLSGLKEGQTVVTGGQLKLKNGSPVTINNSIEPADQANPKITGD
ncbi:MAG TPA: efflux transporter periplasmic adaptor subunit, partial [Coxiellaceae bacterium]|nr:efflux transporter periplasmic adaptor subunit [Coxiellaceae bacterium]